MAVKLEGVRGSRWAAKTAASREIKNQGSSDPLEAQKIAQRGSQGLQFGLCCRIVIIRLDFGLDAVFREETPIRLS